MATEIESELSKSAESARLISVYRRRAKRYDRSAILLYLLGFRHETYRKRAIECLDLKVGDTVVDLGCGTGLSFPFLHARVGPTGRIIGVDLTDAMLGQARSRVAAHGWSNIRLVQSDIADYVFPEDIDGIISAFVLTLTARFDEVIRQGARALLPDRRFVILDFKRPSG
jgi:ubiquinone/menaquinone biosynthesis C-methylase UbiE